MGYRETQLLLSVEALERIDKEVSQLIRSGSAPRQVIDRALYRRDLAVEEAQKWNQRLQNERSGPNGHDREHPR